ncbi:MAG TPA: hypothetical protein VNH53_08990 [Sphingomicrobium sp.]|jgi:hypothetical protein|nr:hypothetical protein [Sphingomicrobium sp.]
MQSIVEAAEFCDGAEQLIAANILEALAGLEKVGFERSVILAAAHLAVAAFEAQGEPRQ